MEHTRVFPRLTVRLKAEVRTSAGAPWQLAWILNLSAGGALLHTDQELPALATLSPLRFPLRRAAADSGTLIEVQALVLRSLPSSGQTDHPGYLSGLQFLDLQGESFEAVRRFVFERVPREPLSGA
jgi:hypothetical protein